MKTETINAVACEFCDHSERFAQPDQVGSDLDTYAVVRARVCRHEQRCPENPLVKTIIDIRELLKSTRILPSQVELCEKLQAAVRMTHDCFLYNGDRPGKHCHHKNTHKDRIEPTATDIEVCDDCGMSRAIYEVMEQSPWLTVDIEAEKKRCPECFDDPEGKKTCGYCNPQPIKQAPQKRRPPEPKPIRPTTKRIVSTAPARLAAAKVKPGPVAAGSKVKVTKTEQPAARSRRHRTSKYIGVSQPAGSRRWRADGARDSKCKYLGTRGTEEEAALLVAEYHGRTDAIILLKKIIAGKLPIEAGQVLQKSAVKAVATTTADAEDKKQEAEAAAGLDEIKGEFTWRWECKGCGNDVNPQSSGHCHKCGGSSFEKIPVLKDPQAFLDRPQGRHSTD